MSVETNLYPDFAVTHEELRELARSFLDEMYTEDIFAALHDVHSSAAMNRRIYAEHRVALIEETIGREAVQKVNSHVAEKHRQSVGDYVWRIVREGSEQELQQLKDDWEAGRFEVFRDSRFTARVQVTENGSQSGARQALADAQAAVLQNASEDEHTKAEARRLSLFAWQTVNRLDPFVTFALDYDDEFRVSSPLGVVVDMLDALLCKRQIENGFMDLTLAKYRTTFAESRASLSAAQKCAEALEATHSPFAFAYHVHGQTRVEFQYGGNDPDSAMQDLLRRVADRVQRIGL